MSRMRCLSLCLLLAAALPACRTRLSGASPGETPAARATAPAKAPSPFVRVEDPPRDTAGAGTPSSVERLPEFVVHSHGTYERGGVVPLREARSENQLVGPYRQPEWTTQRRFATTRTYVLSQGQVELETWWKGKFDDDTRADSLFQQEIGVGLPHRFQLDFYGNVTNNEEDGTEFQGTQLEVRWAPADWGRIPLNPTLYGEWKFNAHGAPDAWEAKLLLAQDFGCAWHTAANLFFEREVGGDLAEEMGVSVAAGRAIVDQRLSAGVELKYELATEKGSRNDPTQELLLGPSLQWRPWPNTHVDLVPLFGLTEDAPTVEAYVVLGIDIGGGGEGHLAPTSTRSR